jgi:LmbE family N-acetylglucosaminyl deacetylase
MLSLQTGRPRAAPLRVLAIGAHSDDAEIGCGGTVLKLIQDGTIAAICWVVLTGESTRADEARASAEAMLEGAPEKLILQRDFRDGFLPYQGAEVKGFFEEVKRDFSPDLILTHQRHDLHQDHRTACELTWNTFRDHFILEYEVPKYDGDMGQPNFFVTLDGDICARKIEHLMTHFGTQVGKRWFKDDLFSGLMRLRGMECNSPTSYAEAFYCRKAVLA